ncbi:MAG: PKD repeat protein, partial [Planctomycetota bacterium]
MSVKYLLLIASIVLSFKISAQVTADFSSNTNSGCPNPLLVIISDMSTSSGGVINSWSWQIDGPAGFSSVVSSTNQVSSSLIISGFYSVSLTVCDNNNICDTKVELTFIEIFELPSYTYSISPIIGCAPQEVCFDIDIIPGCGTTANVLFDVNDGVVYRGDSFCHIYNTVGDYFDFTFSTENSCGCVLTETISDTISVVVIPTANLVADQNFSCTAPLNVNFTNMSIASSGATYIWNIPGLVSNVSTTNLTQSFGIGNYDVQLIVTEPGSCADTILFSNMISVGNNPIADFESVVLEVCEGESIQFNDSSNGTPVSWLWEVVGTAITSNSQNPMINFPNMGVFDIRLTTTYAGACQDVITKLALITVNSSPVNSFTITDSGSCVIPLNTVFNSTSTNSMNSVWSFPGGTPSSAIGNGPINVSYTNTGSYNISLSDTSINGCSATTNYNSVVNLEELTANFFSDNYYGCMPLSAIFSVTTNNVDPIVSYSWNLPGSNSGVSILEDPTAIYNSNSCFDVDLIVVSALGCRDTVVNDDFICVGISPIVNFDFTPISACFEEEDVCFTFTGSGADTLLWNFDDGPLLWSSPDSTPCHAYTSDLGNYSPTLIAFNNGCSSDTVTYLDSVSILGPIADFTSSIVSCVDWNTIEFTNSSLEADSSYWVFGDASVAFGSDTSTLVNPVWVYPPIDSVMNYTVTLVVYKDSFGCEDTITQAISVFPPDASFSISDSIGCTPFTINFQNTSLDVTSVGLDTRWNWVDNYYFGTSNVNTVWNGTSFRSKTYNTPGVYTIIMRNRDSRGCLDTIRKPNLITIHGTVVDFNSDITEGCLPLFINFYDSSFAPLTYIESWHWDFGTGNPADTSNIQNPSFVYIDGGYYTVTLSVVDSFGCTTILNLNNYIFAHEPLASFSLSDTFICDNQSVSVTNLSVGEVLTYDWQFQNGSPAVFNPTGSPPIISFNTEGTQDMYLEVTDNIGCVDDTTIVLPVFDITAAGVADIDFSVCSSPPLLVSFTNNSNNNIDSSSVLWDFGNGITSNDFNPSTLYSSPGEYIVTLAINSLTGCMDIAVIDTIVIEGPWGLVESINVNDLCGCDTAIFAIKTLNAINPTFLTGDGQAIPFSPVGLLGDTIYDTLKVAYCTLGSFIPSLYFSQGVCSYSVPVMVSDYIGVDSLASNFSYQNTVYCDTASICFTDLSENELNGSGNVHSWLWDFGDGNNSTIQNPCNFFDSPGVYNVCLTVSDSFLCEKTFCDSVLIRFNPIVAVGLSDSTICLGDEINFFDSSTLISGAILDSVFWNFGTGNS